MFLIALQFDADYANFANYFDILRQIRRINPSLPPKAQRIWGPRGSDQMLERGVVSFIQRRETSPYVNNRSPQMR